MRGYPTSTQPRTGGAAHSLPSPTGVLSFSAAPPAPVKPVVPGQAAATTPTQGPKQSFSDFQGKLRGVLEEAGYDIKSMNIGVTEDGNLYVKDIDVGTHIDETYDSYTAYQYATGQYIKAPGQGQATIFDYMMGIEAHIGTPQAYIPAQRQYHIAEYYGGVSYVYNQEEEYNGYNDSIGISSGISGWY